MISEEQTRGMRGGSTYDEQARTFGWLLMGSGVGGSVSDLGLDLGDAWDLAGCSLRGAFE